MTIYEDNPTLNIHEDEAWIDPNIQSFYLTIGERGYGKSILSEYVANELYDNGVTIIDLHAVSNLENFFWCVNLNHGKKHKEWMEKHPNERVPLQCKCKQAYPIMILCPVYQVWDQKKLDFANGKYYTKEELVKKGYLEYDRNHPIEKPKHLQPVPLIVIKHVPLPKKAKGARNEEFIKIFTEALIQCRKERRILCVNPLMWDEDHEAYHFKTLEIILRQIRHIAYEHFQPLSEKLLGKHWNKWTVQEKSWHRTAIIMREASEILVSGTKGDYSGDSLLTKKASMSFAKSSRHFSINIILDLQRYEDLFLPVREQHSILILKHTPEKLLGEKLSQYEEKIDSKRLEILEKTRYSSKGFKKANRLWPNIKRLKHNYAYIVKSENIPRLQKIPMPSFHHKEPTDNWCKIMNVSYTTNKELIKTEIETKIDNNMLKPNESQEKILYHTIRELKEVKTMKWDEILTKLTEMQEHGSIVYPKSFKDITNNAIRKKYSDMKRKTEIILTA
ncbi:MAG: hypothetical protein IIC67_11655 [Thaumarchaeota archaeon]|nr:hypothetical protein [Nitrososphaerota archaeon]